MNDENRARRLIQEARKEKVAMKELMEEADDKVNQRVRRVKEDARRHIGKAEEMMQTAKDGHQRANELIEGSRVEQEGWKVEKKDLEQKLANALDNVNELTGKIRYCRNQRTASLREKRPPKAEDTSKSGPASHANIPTSLVSKVLEQMRRSAGPRIAAGTRLPGTFPGEGASLGTTLRSIADANLHSVNDHAAGLVTKGEHEHRTPERSDSRPTSSLARSPIIVGPAIPSKAGTVQSVPIGPGPLFQTFFMDSTEEILRALLPAGSYAEWKVSEVMTMIVVAKYSMAETVKEKLDALGFDLDIVFQTEEDCKFKRWANANDFQEGNQKNPCLQCTDC